MSTLLIAAATSWYLFVHGESMLLLNADRFSAALTLKECLAWRNEINRQTNGGRPVAYCLPYGGGEEDLKAIKEAD